MGVEVLQLGLGPPPCVTECGAAVSEQGKDPLVERAAGQCAGPAAGRGFTPGHQVGGCEDQAGLTYHGADHEAQARGLQVAGAGGGPEVRKGRPDGCHACDLREQSERQCRRGQEARRCRGRVNVRLYWRHEGGERLRRRGAGGVASAPFGQGEPGGRGGVRRRGLAVVGGRTAGKVGCRRRGRRGGWG
jgi:hypothetical protein